MDLPTDWDPISNISHMENSSCRFVVYLLLMTLGCVLMLLGISWLMFLGLALIQLGPFVVTQKPGISNLASFLMFAVSAVVFFILDLIHGDAFVQNARPLWFWVTVVAAWICAIITGFLKWRKAESSRGT